MKKIKDFIRFIKFKRLEKSKTVIVIVFALGVAVGGHFFAYAAQFIDSFLDTSRVANIWNVEVDTANGEVKLAQRSCDNTVWFCDMTWRCPGLMGDGNGLLVKRTYEGNRQWKIWNNDCNTPECGIDGGQGGDNLVVDNTVDFSAYYPAREACKAVGGRLPTINELQCMYTYRSSFGSFYSNYHWSSTEYNSSSAYIFRFEYGDISYGSKSSSFYTRCVRGW